MFRSPRYTDLFAVGSFANAGALGLLWPPTARRRAWSLLALAWIAVFSVGLWTQTKSAYDWSLARFPGFKEAERRHVRAYLATGELAPLKAADPAELPFPRAVPLAGLLDAPSIRELLPMGIRPALPLFPAEGSGGFALAPDGPRPGTSGRVWIARQGPAHFTSEALPSDLLPYLHFEVSGSPELDASAVRIESLGGASHLAPFPLEGDRWHAADADVPAGARARVVVDVPPGAHWLAFTEPVELGRASWADHWLLRRSAWITAAAALLFALALGALAVRDTRQAANRGT
jgi:hypothetical protein